VKLLNAYTVQEATDHTFVVPSRVLKRFVLNAASLVVIIPSFFRRKHADG